MMNKKLLDATLEVFALNENDVINEIRRLANRAGVRELPASHSAVATFLLPNSETNPSPEGENLFVVYHETTSRGRNLMVAAMTKDLLNRTEPKNVRAMEAVNFVGLAPVEGEKVASLLGPFNIEDFARLTLTPPLVTQPARLDF
jgi:hypothetical protein